MMYGLISQIQNTLKEEIRYICQINIGYVNDVYVVVTNREKYIVKCYRISDKEQIRLSIAVQKYLHNKGMSPNIIVEHIGELSFVVQQYIYSQNEEKNWELFGKTLGLIHEYLDEYDSSNVKNFCFDDFHGCLQDIENNGKEVSELICLKKELWKRIHFPELEYRQLIHGDYTWNNILPCNNLYQVIDFDETKKYYSVYDVAKVVFTLILNRENKWRESASDFLNGYQSIRQLTSEEKREFFNVYAYTLVMDFGGIKNKPNKNSNYLKMRTEKHRKVLNLINDFKEIGDCLI